MSRPEIQTIQGVVVHENMRSVFLPPVANSFLNMENWLKRMLLGKGASSSPGAKARFKLQKPISFTSIQVCLHHSICQITAVSTSPL